MVQALGSWDLTLSPDTPADVLDALDYYGHIAVISGRVDPRQVGDGLLDAARYVGVLRKRATGSSAPKFSGDGMAAWLGSEDLGQIYETAVELTSATFVSAISALLPDAVTTGTIHAQAGTTTQRIQWVTPKKAITTICESFGAGGLGADAVEWRVNGDASFDAGKVSELYNTTPACVITRTPGRDMRLQGLAGTFGVTRDSEDFTSRLILMGEGAGLTLVTATADNPAVPYKDLQGNLVQMSRIVSESQTPASSAASRAELLLAQYLTTNDQLTMSTSDYDIISLQDDVTTGSFSVGDMVWVFDPDAGLVDTANEITFRGQRLNPIKLRVTEATWPITSGNTVAYRDKNGVWTDLTDYVQFESGDTTLVVGAFARTLAGTGFEPVSWRPAVDTSIPAVPVFVTPFTSATYLDARGFGRAKMRVKWNAPLNTDGSVILDGDHYEIRYKVDTDVFYQGTWEALGATTWAAMNTWAQPFDYPDVAWHIAYAAYGESEVTIQDLAAGVGYDFEIRLVDTSQNASDWSATTTAQANPDTLPPSTPAAPTVAASRIAVQVTHELGKATGGTFNLESDLDHLNVYVSNEPTYMPGPDTLVGKLRANQGTIQAQVAAVGTFQVEEVDARWVKVIAVDINGNLSNASVAASATAMLIDDAHISDLTVTKVTAGTISADWIIGARIKTANIGARVELNTGGLQAYNAAGTQTVDVAAATGEVAIIGQLSSGTGGDRVVVNPTGSALPEIRFYPTSGTDYASVSSFTSGGSVKLELSGQASSGFVARSIFDGDAVSVEVVNAATEDLDGGHLSLGGGSALIGYNSGAAVNELQFAATYTAHFGKWVDYSDLGASVGLFTGHVTCTATATTIGYGTTASSIRYPICQHNDTLGIGAISPLQVHAVVTTGFIVEVNAFQGGGFDCYFWNFRV